MYKFTVSPLFMSDGIELKNIIIPIVGDDILVSKYEYPFSLNVKVPPISNRYYIFSKKKLSPDQMINCVVKFEELNQK